ncbi:NAD(P)-binding protein [Auriculariales sp. MPI-PUGE-AT-0066]|nr:NAD(P)-binding protein [Auriculariales sp. MPI-PUGE-AT-0066]
MSTTALTFSKFAVAGGAGRLGKFIAKGLLAHGAEVTVLSRSASTVVPDGATVCVVDYGNAGSLKAALIGIEVVVSCLAGGGFGVQAALADAAKAAGVKLFVPSEFGVDTSVLPRDHLLAGKQAFAEHLHSIGLPYTRYLTGWFADSTFIAPFGFDVPNKLITIVGPGTYPVSFTGCPDIAHFVGYTLTRLPKKHLENQTLRIEGDKKTLLEVKGIFEKVYGGNFTMVHRDVEEVQKVVNDKGAEAFLDLILLTNPRGWTDLKVNDNQLVPEFKPTNVEGYLRKITA